MDEEEVVYTTLEEQDIDELARLYERRKELVPGTDEYDANLQLIERTHKMQNEIRKIDQVYVTKEDDRRHELELKQKEYDLKMEELKARLREIDSNMDMKDKEMRQRRNELIVKIVELSLGTGISLASAWCMFKFNIKYGKVGTLEAIRLLDIFRKRKR